MRRIKAIVYGVGEMGRLMTKLMVEKGIDIVGAIGHTSNIGKDLGQVAELGYPLHIKISDDADAVLSQREADIAVVAVGSEMERMYPCFKKCVEHGLDVITLAEEAFYPWTSSPQLTSELDKLAKRHGVTVSATGVQDIFWLSLITVLTGASHTIESITGQSSCNIDEYGPVVAEYNHVGKTKEEFYQKIKEQKVEPSYFRMGAEAIIADLGLTIKKIEQRNEPTIAEVDIESKSLGKIVKKGQVIGMVQITEVDTEQGIRLRGEQIHKIFRKGEVQTNKWFIKGFPDIYVENERLPGKVTSCTAMVNRIPDVINSEPGFITIEKLPKPKFRAFPLHYYLKE